MILKPPFVRTSLERFLNLNDDAFVCGRVTTFCVTPCVTLDNMNRYTKAAAEAFEYHTAKVKAVLAHTVPESPLKILDIQSYGL